MGVGRLASPQDSIPSSKMAVILAVLHVVIRGLDELAPKCVKPGMVSKCRFLPDGVALTWEGSRTCLRWVGLCSAAVGPAWPRSLSCPPSTYHWDTLVPS